MTRLKQHFLGLCLVAFVFFVSMPAWADIKGAVSGIVIDPTGAAIPQVSVRATNTATGVVSTAVTDGKGFYSFPTLSVGLYNIQIQQAGYTTFTQANVVVNANSLIRLDVHLQLGTVTDNVVVQSNAVQIETQNTQMGEVIEAEKIQAVPLNGRSFIDLLALQPGVSPNNVTAFNTGTGIGGKTISGSLGNGNQSVNGGRSGSNAFLVNGAYAEEGAHAAAALVPNLDSIQEFRIITNNYNAEYGNYSGGQVNVVTKSGTNRFHGSLFEFLRNTSFDASNYKTRKVSPFKQNQFGGTFGGPIVHDKMFGFIDYQGTRQTVASLLTPYQVPTLAQRSGDFSDSASAAALAAKKVGGTATNNKWAQILSSRLGYTVTPGERYYVAGCTTTSQCVFPNAKIPANAVDPVSKNLIGFIPQASDTTNSSFTTNAYPQTLSDDKGAARADFNTRAGTLFVYYFRDHFNGINPFFRHTNAPGFSSGNTGFTNMVNLGLTTTINSSMVNDARVAYLRVSGTLGLPVGGTATGAIGKLGFSTAAGNGGLAPVVASYEGVPVVALKGANFGTTNSTIRQANNTIQVLDNVIKTLGTHSIQFGFNFHYDQINERNTSCPNGCFTFKGNETGIDSADFLIGAPSVFNQAGQTQLNSRSNYIGVYAQDGWRVRPTLTFNYGLRWEVSQPWYDTKNMLSTFVPGQQSQLFPNAPRGMVFPGDKGIPNTIAGTRYNNFAPRIGVAYAPASGQYSIRAGFGMFYSSIQQVSGMNTAGGPPFNIYYGSPGSTPPLMGSPYIERYSGNVNHVTFPGPLPPANVSPSNPSNIDFTQFEQISGSYGIYPGNKLPMIENYELSVQRQLGNAMVLSISYVGTAGRHQMTSIESNPGDPNLCLELSDPANLAPGSDACGPFGEDQEYVRKDGTLVEGTRNRFGTLALGSNPWMKAAAGSSYNSLQTSLKQTSRWENFLIAYTWSKNMDNSSDVFDSSDPFNPSRSRGLSYQDIPHNFVASYTVQLPFQKLVQSRSLDRLTEGWAVAGITSLVSGEVITLSELNDDNNLSGDFYAQADVPSYAGGGARLFDPSVTSKNPRTGKPYFNPSFFTTSPIGQQGNVMRRYFHGPGVNKTDMTLMKNTKLFESSQLQFRAEAFNVFNHTQFIGVDGEIGDGLFGASLATRPERILQFGLKLSF